MQIHSLPESSLFHVSVLLYYAHVKRVANSQCFVCTWVSWKNLQMEDFSRPKAWSIGIAGFNLSSDGRENEDVRKILTSQLSAHDIDHLASREGGVDQENSSALETADPTREIAINLLQLNAEFWNHSLQLFQNLGVVHRQRRMYSIQLKRSVDSAADLGGEFLIPDLTRAVRPRLL